MDEDGLEERARSITDASRRCCVDGRCNCAAMSAAASSGSIPAASSSASTRACFGCVRRGRDASTPGSARCQRAARVITWSSTPASASPSMSSTTWSNMDPGSRRRATTGWANSARSSHTATTRRHLRQADRTERPQGLHLALEGLDLGVVAREEHGQLRGEQHELAPPGEVGADLVVLADAGQLAEAGQARRRDHREDGRILAQEPSRQARRRCAQCRRPAAPPRAPPPLRASPSATPTDRRRGQRRCEVPDRLAGVEPEGEDGQRRGGDAVVDVALDVLAALLGRAPHDEVVDHLVGDGREGGLAVAVLPEPPHVAQHLAPPEPVVERGVHRHVEVGRDGVAPHGPHGVGVVVGRHEDAGHDLLLGRRRRPPARSARPSTRRRR